MITGHDEDTILAVSSAEGRADRAIVRLSGGEAVGVAREVFDGREPVDWTATFRAWCGALRLDEGVRVPAIAYVMLAPRSYTREDVVELHVPGAPVVVDMVLRAIFDAAAGRVRAAMPGEFTRRAFLNGRIDLAQAEAVLAVIRATSETELRSALTMLRGRSTRRIHEIQARLGRVRARVEAALDFGDQDIELVPPSEVAAEIDAARAGVAALLGDSDDAPTQTGAVPVVIAGLPNAGKSTLFNALCGRAHSIVTPTPGTTRDAVAASVELEDITFRLVDTAGIAEFDTHLERAAVTRAREWLDSARIVLFLHDAATPFADEEVRLLESLDARRTILLLSKADLASARCLESPTVSEHAWRALPVSALERSGLDALVGLLVAMVQEGKVDLSSQGALAGVRQREAARAALRVLDEAAETVRAGMGYEFAALLLREASEHLAVITGEVTTEDILDQIFARFCIGK